ncbi:MAG: hypothetical protein ACHQET_12765 [Chitinophagales bacterium]
MNEFPLYGHWLNYLDLFGHIFREGLFTEEYFIIPGTEKRVSMTDIKARAFEEIYSYLPSRAEIDFVIDKIQDIQPIHLVEMLSEIPTKM